MQLLYIDREFSGGARTPDSAALSITDNLDLRCRVIMADWHPGGNENTFISKRDGGDEWHFRTQDITGRLQFLWWDTGGVETVETADTDIPFVDGQTGWVRVRRSGTSVTFFYSETDTNDHTAVVWTQLGGVQTTPAGSIRSTVGTFVVVGTAFAFAGGEALDGYIYTAAIVNDVTTVASPDFTNTAQWAVGDGKGTSGVDAQGNIWSLWDAGRIIGDNMGHIPGLHIAVHAAFGTGFASISNQTLLTLDWFTITDDVRTIHTERGKNYELDRIDMGIAQIDLENFDGKYNAHNTESPYYPNVRPMVPIRIRAVYEGTIYPIWAGFVERWPVTTTPDNSIVSVQCADLFKPLSMAQVAQEDRLAVVTALSPVAVWRFTGGGTDDESVAGTHDLTFAGSPTTGQPGAWNNDEAVGFDGVDDAATVANEVDVELFSDMTLEMWFKPERAVVQTVETHNADTTWVAPANVTAVTVECWGSGGGGEAGVSGSPIAGGGGGAGAYARVTVKVVPGDGYAIDIGAAGTAGTGVGGNGGNGGDTTFGGSMVVADGGKGGSGGGTGGQGGQASASTGTLRRSGGRGGDAELFVFPQGGGGGGGGSGSRTVNGQAGGQGTNSKAGAGGNGEGKGGDGGINGSNGTIGTAPGGGGGGGGTFLSTDGDGGAGAVGRVKLTYSEAVEMIPFSVRGSNVLYQLRWDGFELAFAPASTSTTYYSFGECTADEWHHVAVSIDWSGSTRIIRGYLDGVLMFDEISGHQPVAEVRSVAIGRRATGPSSWFKGDISEVVIYPTALTGEQITELHDATFEGFATELTSERIAFILTESAFLGAPITVYDLETGVSLMDGPSSPTGTTALESIQQAADTERGWFFIAADGTPTFHNRHYRLLEQATPIATIDETDYEAIEAGVDDELIFNDVAVSAATEALPFRATDQESIDLFGLRPFDLTIYPDNEDEAYDAAHYIVQQYADDVTRISFLGFEIVETSDIALLLGAEIGDRYNVEAPMNGDDLDLDCYVEKITFDIDLSKRFYTTWQLSAASSDQFWLMGVPGFSEVGVTTHFGY